MHESQEQGTHTYEKSRPFARIASIAVLATAIISCGALANLQNKSISIGNYIVRSRLLYEDKDIQYDFEVSNRSYAENCGASFDNLRLYYEDTARLGFWFSYRDNIFFQSRNMPFDNDWNASGYEDC